jgi:hypothetical protein
VTELVDVNGAPGPVDVRLPQGRDVAAGAQGGGWTAGGAADVPGGVTRSLRSGSGVVVRCGKVYT